MGIVAPWPRPTRVIPLAFGIASGERLTSVESVGVALALVSVMVVAWAAERGSDAERRGQRGAPWASGWR